MKSRHTQEQLIVFTRYPEPGTTKTRLVKTLGLHGAAAIHKKLTEHTLVQVREYQRLNPSDIIICYEGGGPDRIRKWLGSGFYYRRQEKGDLGQRMQKAFKAAFKQEYTRIVIIGTDCPALRARHLVQAFQALHHRDLVLGPTTDGGYYLVGLNRNEKSIFEHIPWSTDKVLERTLAIAAQQGLTTDLLATLSDVDRPEDLKHFNHYSYTERG